MKKQNLIQIFHLKIDVIKKSAIRIQESEIRKNPGFFKTDFCKNPNPHPIQKFDLLPPLVNSHCFKTILSC